MCFVRGVVSEISIVSGPARAQPNLRTGAAVKGRWRYPTWWRNGEDSCRQHQRDTGMGRNV